jgi:hypothetical protein
LTASRRVADILVDGSEWVGAVDCGASVVDGAETPV